MGHVGVLRHNGSNGSHALPIPSAERIAEKANIQCLISHNTASKVDVVSSFRIGFSAR
jgi:hypothetical protein